MSRDESRLELSCTGTEYWPRGRNKEYSDSRRKPLSARRAAAHRPQRATAGASAPRARLGFAQHPRAATSCTAVPPTAAAAAARRRARRAYPAHRASYATMGLSQNLVLGEYQWILVRKLDRKRRRRFAGGLFCREWRALQGLAGQPRPALGFSKAQSRGSSATRAPARPVTAAAACHGKERLRARFGGRRVRRLYRQPLRSPAVLRRSATHAARFGHLWRVESPWPAGWRDAAAVLAATARVAPCSHRC